MRRKRIKLIVLCALSFTIVGAFAHAQITPPPGSTTPTFISGNDLGFRVEHRRGDHVTGTLMVRINGAWLVAEPAPGAKALTLK